MICGGNTTIPGFSNRLKEELVYLLDQNNKNYSVNLSQKGAWEACEGGCELGFSSYMMSLPWITVEDYEEIGSNIVHYVTW